MQNAAANPGRRWLAHLGLNLYTLNWVLLIAGLLAYVVIRWTGLWGFGRLAVWLTVFGVIATVIVLSIKAWRRGGIIVRMVLGAGHVILLCAAATVLIPRVRESFAIAQLEKVGFEIRFRHETRHPRDRTFAQNLFGDAALRFFGWQKCHVSASHRGKTKEQLTAFNDHLRFLSAIRRIERLFIYDIAISDTGARSLGEIPSLRWLSVRDCQITDRGLASLAKISGVELLDVHGAKISDAGLAALASNSSLQHLVLSNTAIGDEGLDHLTGLRLQYLDLAGTRITDDGLTTLAKIWRLGSIRLEGTQITSKGITNAAAIPGLDSIDARSTPFAAESTPVSSRPGLLIVTQQYP